MEIVFFAHSITKDNEAGNATGWLQGKLSEEGIKRAKTVASQLSSQQLDAVFCSDLRRAINSTKIFFEEKFPTYIDWRLRECNYGDHDGDKAADFKKNREHEYIDCEYPGGESYKDVEARMASFLKDVSEMFKGKKIAIVGHQATQLSLEVLINKKSWHDAIEADWRKTRAWQLGWVYKSD